MSDLFEAAERRAQQARMAGKAKNAFTLVLDGMEVPVLSGRVSRSIDTPADGWTAEIAWLPGKDRELDKRVRPFGYTKAQVYLGPTLVNTGRLYTVTNSFGVAGLTKQLEGWSYTADLVDSHVTPKDRDHLTGAWQYNWTGLSVWNICNALCRPLGIGVRTNLGAAKWTEPFPYVQAELTETYADVFTKLAFQRGMLVTNDEEGALFLTTAKRTGFPVATLGEGDIAAYQKSQAASGVKSPKWEAKFDGRKRYGTYTVYGQSGMADDIQSTETDPVVPASRIMNVISGDDTIGNVGVAAKWKRSKQLVEALSIPFPVTTWCDAYNQLWAPNTFVTVVAPSIHVDKGFTFLIREVEYLHEAGGQTAQLSLVPLQVYTGEDLKEPWVTA
jgi:prophage tail gpP-like protein